MNDAEQALVKQAQRGDRAAFEELVRRTSRLIYARLYLETGDVHRTEDLVQETYLTAFRSLSRLDSAEKFRPWLLRIAQNTALDDQRRGQRRKRSVHFEAAELGDLATATPGPGELAAGKEMKQKVLAVLRSLPEEYRLPLTLRYLAGADHQTIEMEMGLTNGSLRGLLHRGLQLLRKEMDRILPREE
jgi:RNA polymerase sigma-70 factor (ECF subfamily)